MPGGLDDFVTRLDIQVVREGHQLCLAGRLDRHSAPPLREALRAAIDGGDGDLTVEMGNLEIWDGVGLGVLSGASRRARRTGRRLLLTDVRARELRLLRAARIPLAATPEGTPAPPAEPAAGRDEEAGRLAS
jgi:anti-anti-sigma factor